MAFPFAINIVKVKVTFREVAYLKFSQNVCHNIETINFPVMGNCYGTTLGHLSYALEEASFDETEVICHAVCIDFCIIICVV